MGAAAPFSPLDLPGLTAWYDASDATSFTFSSGSVVSQWNDKSGNGLHLTQATVGNQPARTGTQNGRATVVYGEDDQLNHTPSTPIGSAGLTVAQVWKKTGAPGYFKPPFTTSHGTNMPRPFDRWEVSTGTENKLWIDSSGASNINAVFDLNGQTTWCVHILELDKDAGGAGIHGVREIANGVVGTSTSHTASWSTTSQVLHMGARADLATDFIGEVAEVVAVEGVLSAADLADLETYLANKWGITI